MAGGGFIFVLGLIAFAAHLAWQVVRLDINDSAHCLKQFKSNRDAGLDFVRRDVAAGGVLSIAAFGLAHPGSEDQDRAKRS